MKRASFAINILLGAAVLVIAAFAAREALVLGYGTGEAKKEAVSNSLKKSLPALADYASIAEGGLFGKGSLSTAKADIVETGPRNLVLVGTAEGPGYAIFMDMDTGLQKAFKKGESAFGGGLVATISTKQAELESGGRRVLFKVPSAMPAFDARPAAAQKAAIATRKGEAQWALDQRAVAGIFDNMDKVLTDARFTPYVDAGKLSGFKISEIKSGGVFGTIGLQDGDVVLNINGYPLDSPGKVAQVMGGLRGETEVRVDILRGRQPRTLKYQIR